MSERPRRLDPLPEDQWDDRTRSALRPLLPAERANPRDAGNVLATMVRHPDLTQAYLTFNAYVLTKSTLSQRVREVALLRVVHRRDCEYLWSHHLPIAHRAGLTDEDIDGIRRGEATDEVDRTVLNAVDDLVDDNTISDTTWAALSRHFTDQQRMDLVFTIGAYALLGMAVNTFGIEEEG
ncbi:MULTISPECIES: carboxymuconolactone decarboxylase family protein [unclassified Mycobacterium]|uniref:carboxymuconolactone decarboxylase family protein n=1 Tax=unclassified Mycobacterium TaxID=2642494 RepID=UPI0029C7E8ED|nr:MULTISPECIES: carboxymuconolactone decarboxylase family protein [unclassified Mycobacterium]